MSGNVFVTLLGQIDGSALVSLDLADIQTIGLSSGYLKATAEVHEPLSGKTLNGSGSAVIAVSDYAMTFMDINNKYYRPGQQQSFYVSVHGLFENCQTHYNCQ